MHSLSIQFFPTNLRSAMGLMINTGYLIALGLVTAGSAGVIYAITKYLLRDHHSTILKNDFKKNCFKIKHNLRMIEKEHQAVKKRIASSISAISRDIGDDDSSSVNSTQTMVLTTKKILELEEALTRLLERLDSLPCRGLALDLTTPSFLQIDTIQLQPLSDIANSLIEDKKKLIIAIQSTSKSFGAGHSGFASYCSPSSLY